MTRSLRSSRLVLTISMAALAGLSASPGALAGAGSHLHRSGPETPTAALPVVEPVLETPSRFDDDTGGNADADDPAIWVHRQQWRSVVFGTLKNGGLDAYDLGGELVQHVDAPAAPADGLESSRFNNVDIASGVRLGKHRRDIAVVTDRGRDRLRFYAIDPAGSPAGEGLLEDVTVTDPPRLFNETEADVENQETGYGLAVSPASDGGMPWVAISRRHTTSIGLFKLAAHHNSLTYRASDSVDLPDTFTLRDGSSWSPCEDPGEGPQVEGMVADVRRHVLYAAQEDIGIWRIPLRGSHLGQPKLVEKVREFGVPATFDPEAEECVLDGPVFAGRHLSADAEGLTIAYGPHGRDQLFASSQGDSTFALFRLRSYPTFISNLRIGPAAGSSSDPDAVDHSDGASVFPGPVGHRFRGGLLVVHDGENTPGSVDPSGEVRADTDFKYVRWDDVIGAVAKGRN